MKRFSLLLALWAASLSSIAAPAASVDETIDPGKSYWNEHVHYPYPVHSAKLRDRHGSDWELAYLDVFHGDAAARAKAPVLVMLHGRGMNSGYWGTLLEAPLAAGWRVISIDWGHWGKSLPRNLKVPINRSLDDVRELVHQLVVKQLGIAQADYLGHSLGGQLAAGYALKYPANVRRLVLYAPGGMESVPQTTIQFLKLDDPALSTDEGKFLTLWKGGTLPGLSKTAEEVRSAFYQARPGKLPYGHKENPLSRYSANSRARAMDGNPQEAERYRQIYSWYTVSALLESRQDDESSLPARFSRIQAPTLLLLGLQDPVFPIPGTGNTQLVGDMVHPFYMMARSRKMPLQIKLYKNAGHFIHTDLPDEMSSDVLSFLKQGEVAGPLYAGNPEAYLPPARTALATLPAPVGEFKAAWEKTLLKQDLAGVRQLLHPEIKHTGRNFEQAVGFFQSFISNVTRWELVVLGAELINGEWVLDVETRNDFGVHPDRFVLKQHEGQWRFFGNRL